MICLTNVLKFHNKKAYDMVVKKYKMILILLIIQFSTFVVAEDILMDTVEQQVKLDASWEKVQNDMSDKRLLSILGYPKLIWRTSSECFFYYDELPVIYRNKLNGYKSVKPLTYGHNGYYKGLVYLEYTKAEPIIVKDDRALTILPKTRVMNERKAVKHQQEQVANNPGYVAVGIYYYNDIDFPSKRMYRIKSKTQTNCMSIDSTIIQDELSKIENKQKWQCPESWEQLPNKYRERETQRTDIMSHWEHEIFEYLNTLESDYTESERKLFGKFTESRIVEILGEPHVKRNIPGGMVWQYGDVYDENEFKYSKDISSKETGFGKIVFVQNERGVNVLDKWSEPFWPDVLENIHEPVNPLPPRNQTGTSSLTEEENCLEELPAWTNKELWLKIRKGMIKEKIDSILGECRYSQISFEYDVMSGDNRKILSCYFGQPPKAKENSNYLISYKKNGNGVVIYQEEKRRFFVREWTEPDYSKIQFLSDAAIQEITPKRGREKWEQLCLWRKLKPNMPTSAVERLLGEPHYIKTESGDGIFNLSSDLTWEYGPFEGYGILNFKTSTVEGRKRLTLSDWQEPYWAEVDNEVNGKLDSATIEKPTGDSGQNIQSVPSKQTESYTILQLTNNDYNDKSPEIFDGKAVWQGDSENSSIIFLYDGEVKEFTSQGNSTYPKLSSKFTAWLYSSRLKCCYQDKNINLSKTKPYLFSISSQGVIWQDDNGVSCFDGDTKRTIYEGDAKYGPYCPAISDSLIAWCSFQKGFPGELNIITKDKAINCSLEVYPYSIEASNDNIAISYYDNSASTSEEHGIMSIKNSNFVDGKSSPNLFRIPESSNMKIPMRLKPQGMYQSDILKGCCGPSIYGHKIVWVGDNYDIFIYDGEKTSQITENGYKNLYPKINGDNVVWQAHDGNDYEIFIFDGNSVFQLTNNEFDDLYPSISKGEIIWQAWDGNDYEIMIAETSKNN